MKDLVAELPLWMLKPWLPFGGLFLLLAISFLIASYTWSNRPSGRTGTERISAFHRMAPLGILVIPLLVLLGLAQLLFPFAPPETLVLRSRALRSVDKPVTQPCLTELFDELGRGAAKAPVCLASFLPYGDDSAETREALDRALSQLGDSPTFTRWEILTDSPAFEDKMEEILVRVVDELYPDDTNEMKTRRARDLTSALGIQVRWWPLASASRRVDAGPVVDKALEIFGQAQFSELDYREAEPRLIAALQAAVERAVAMVAPRPLDNAEPPPSPDPPSLRPDVVEAIEVAVVRLLAAKRNIAAGIVEFHRRRDENASENAWRRLRQSLLDAVSTATGNPTGLTLIPGSDISSAGYLDIVGEPWLRSTPGGEWTVHAQLRLSESPQPSWILNLETDTTGGRQDERFECSVSTRLDSTPQTSRSLTDCLPQGLPLAGKSVVLSLRLGKARPVLPNAMWLSITFGNSDGIPPLLRKVALDKPSSVPISTSKNGGLLHQTLSCLLDPNSTVSDMASIRRFRAVLELEEGGKAPFVLQDAGSDGTVIVLDPHPHNGIWIHPAGIDLSRIRAEVIDRSLVRERAVPIKHLLEPGKELHGVPLFPIAFAGPGLPDGIDRLLSTPLVPERNGTDFRNISDPAQNLLEPRSTRVMLPYARPVAFSALPMLRSGSLLSAHAFSAAPLAWRIDLPPSPGKRGGVLWYFDLDAKRQGLLLPESCIPEQKDVDFFCRGSHSEVQSFEPVYDEMRFFPLWLAVLRAARVSAVAWQDDTTEPHEQVTVPVFMTSEMLSRARVASASSGLLMLAVSLSGYAAFLILLRLRQRRKKLLP